MSGTIRRRAQRLTQNLWTLVVPPTTWALHFLFCYVYAAIRCAKSEPAATLDDVRIAIAVATVVSLLVVLISGYIAWAHSRVAGDSPPYQHSTEEDRLRFLAVAKVLLAGLSFVAIVFTAIPAFMFEDCR